MTPELTKKVAELVEAGATVLGPKPKHSPSLVNYPACDAGSAENRRRGVAGRGG